MRGKEIIWGTENFTSGVQARMDIKKRTTSLHSFLHGKVQFVPSVHFQCWNTSENMLGVNLPVGVYWQKQCSPI